MKKLLISITLILLFVSKVGAQEATTTTVAPKNIIKVNGLSLLLTNVSLQYEHSLTGHSSLALGASWLPDRGTPSSVSSKDNSDNVEDFTFGGFAITPEYRYYFSGKGPKGFYAAAYFRYAKYSTDKFKFYYDRDDGTRGTVEYSGDYSTSVGGIMFGSQWLLGEKWTLDWWILGAAFGSQKGEYVGTGEFTPEDQQDIKDEVNSIDVEIVDVEVTTSATKTTFTFEPKFPAFRGFGLCVGYRF